MAKPKTATDRRMFALADGARKGGFETAKAGDEALASEIPMAFRGDWAPLADRQSYRKERFEPGQPAHFVRISP
ncbi:MAG: hypothetical protein JW820_10695 [Spirochaetales bacterium]|nr:hypothetical protein [Spirochaetales bacterium]